MTYYPEDVEHIKEELVKIAARDGLTDEEAMELLDEVHSQIDLGDWSIEEVEN